MENSGSFCGVKRPGREAHHLPPLVPKVMRGAMLPLPQHVFISWYLVKNRGEFTRFKFLQADQQLQQFFVVFLSIFRIMLTLTSVHHIVPNSQIIGQVG